MFTTPCCGQTFGRPGYRCGCGHYWDRERMFNYDLIDDLLFFEEVEDLASGDFLDAAEVEIERDFFSF